jgi:GWxTD domain-containing protein
MRSHLTLPLVLVAVAGLASGCGGSKKSSSAIDLAEVTAAEATYEDADIEHLRFALPEEEQERYRELDPEARAEMMRQYWASVDPTPTTPVNERERDHYLRLAYAREFFGTDEEESGFDRRGELLLRYGPPDERRIVMGDVVEDVGLVPPREIWVYYWLGQAYEMEDPRFTGNFRDFYEIRGTRDDADRDIRQLAPDSQLPAGPGRRGYVPLDAEEQLAMDKLKTMLDRGQEGLRKRPRAYLHDYGGGPLEYVFDVHTFSDHGSGLTRVEINTAFLAEDLAWAPEGGEDATVGDGAGLLVAVLETEVALKTIDWRDVARGWRTTRDRRASGEDRKGVLVLDQSVFAVEPDEYRLALSVRDSVSGNIGLYQTEFAAPAYLPGDFGVSDVQIALDVRPKEPEDSVFVKDALVVIPYPLGTFPRDRDIHLYFEIYGLARSPAGDSLYEVEIMIRPRTTESSGWFGSSKGRITPGVATTYQGRSASPNVQEWIALDPETFREDVYDLEFLVRDLVLEREIRRTLSFGVEN